MSIGRRQFLGSAAASAAGALGIGSVPAAEAAKPVDTRPTAPVPLGKGAKLHVSRVGLGTGFKAWMRESEQTRMGQDAFDRVIAECYDRGVRLFDLADLYGTHQYIARVLAGKPRDSYTLVSKIWWRPKGIPEKERLDADVLVARFLKELKTDYIDVVQLHCVTNADWPKELRRQMDILEKLKEKGVIRAHGVSCHAISALEAAAEEPWVDVVHTRINPYGIKMDGPPEKVVPALKKIHAAGKGVIGMKIIGEGKLSEHDDKREESVSFVLGLGCVDAMIVGFQHPWEIDDFKARVKRTLLAQAKAAGQPVPA
jgi:aryl-alcohol dehydrogenase-like predicted oxidoreductase